MKTCPGCGSDRLHELAWVNVNNGDTEALTREERQSLLDGQEPPLRCDGCGEYQYPTAPDDPEEGHE